MPVIGLEIVERGAYEGGHEWGEVGAYERIDAIAHYAVDPENANNASVTDLALAKRGYDGLVHFSGDLTILRPVQAGRGNRALLMQVPNRGKRLLSRFHMTLGETGTDGTIPPGDGFLFRRGWTVAWTGWQWDMPRDEKRLRIGLLAPQVPKAARGPDSQMQLRLQPNWDWTSISLTDQHTGGLGQHMPIPVADRDDPAARLTVRDGPYGAVEEIPRAEWRFAREEDGEIIDDDGHLTLNGGFKAGRIYDIYYTPRDCPVVGAGMLATRDVAAFLRRDPAAPTAGELDHVIAEGQSQCGRFLRTLLYNGLNADESGHAACDGVLAHIAGGRRGEFNHRYGQPSVQPTPSFGHLFPFADEPQSDPLSGQTAGLLDRQRASGLMPKIFYTDTSSEYWRGDAALSHTDLASGGDLEMADDVRRYLFSSTQHGAGTLPLADATIFGSKGRNRMNIVDYRPLYRAALSNLLAWIAEAAMPPASAYPRASDDSRARRADLIETLAKIPAIGRPKAEVLTTMYPLDLGPAAASGIGTMPAVAGPAPYPDWVSAIDADGNEVAGVHMPDVSVPVATHAGFNPRHPDTGGPGQMLEYVGSTVPFTADQAAREAMGDPRPSITERYRDRTDYLDRIREAARVLIEQGYLLAEDLDVCAELAGQRYDACLEDSR